MRHKLASLKHYSYFCAMIEAHDICKSFGPLRVLSSADLTVGRGEIVSIVGRSGAGKSTLLQILGTLSRPDSGTLRIGGIDPLALSDRELSAFRCRHIGFIFQAHRLLPEFSALENVMIPALIARENRIDARRRASELLNILGLSAREQHKPAEMSGGEQGRVAVARALINRPDVVFADEPSGNLDTMGKQELHRLFFDLRDELEQTFVIVTHDESLAAMSDRSLRMEDGRLT